MHSVIKKIFSKNVISNVPLAGRPKDFLKSWKILTNNKEIFSFVDSCQIPLSVIRHKGESQNGGHKRTKQAKFSEKQTFSTSLISTRTCVYQGVWNVCFFLKILCGLFSFDLCFDIRPFTFSQTSLPLKSCQEKIPVAPHHEFRLKETSATRSAKYLEEGRDFSLSTQRRGISQKSVSSREKGWGSLPSNKSETTLHPVNTSKLRGQIP